MTEPLIGSVHLSDSGFVTDVVDALPARIVGSSAVMPQTAVDPSPADAGSGHVPGLSVAPALPDLSPTGPLKLLVTGERDGANDPVSAAVIERGPIETGESEASATVPAVSATAPLISASNLTNGTSIVGTAGDDVVDASGSGRSVTIDAGAGNDVITGSSYDDIIIGGSGSDLIDGGDGWDTAVYDGSHEAYRTRWNAADGDITVTGQGDVDELSNIEVIAFSDRTIDLAEHWRQLVPVNPDIITTMPDTPVSIEVLLGEHGAERGLQIVEIEGQAIELAAQGTGIRVGQDGVGGYVIRVEAELRFVPDAEDVGIVRFTYTIADQFGDQAVLTAVVSVVADPSGVFDPSMFNPFAADPLMAATATHLLETVNAADWHKEVDDLIDAATSNSGKGSSGNGSGNSGATGGEAVILKATTEVALPSSAVADLMTAATTGSVSAEQIAVAVSSTADASSNVRLKLDFTVTVDETTASALPVDPAEVALALKTLAAEDRIDLRTDFANDNGTSVPASGSPLPLVDLSGTAYRSMADLQRELDNGAMPMRQDGTDVVILVDPSDPMSPEIRLPKVDVTTLTDSDFRFS
jgi:Ca2+-binding RTX toxin-like protein